MFNDSITITINFVLSEKNKHCIFDVLDFCDMHNVTTCKISPIMTNKAALILNDISNIDYYYNVMLYAKEKNINIDADLMAHPWSVLKVFGIEDEGALFCPAQKTEMEIDVNGDVYPCPFLYDSLHKMGNLLFEPFEKVWNGGITELKSLKWSKSSTCVSCDRYHVCGGGCYAFAKINNTEFDGRCVIHEKICH